MPTSWAARSCWRSPTATGRAPSPGACCSISSAALAIAPELATGDGALGFWKALREVYGTTREQRCWVHKIRQRAQQDRSPSSHAPSAPKGHLDGRDPRGGREGLRRLPRGLWPKYDKAVACLAKDRDVVLAFYDVPAEHWKHIRTTNPIESTFATVRLRPPSQGLPQPHDGAHHGLQAVASRPARSGVAWTQARTRSPTSFNRSNSRTEKSCDRTRRLKPKRHQLLTSGLQPAAVAERPATVSEGSGRAHELHLSGFGADDQVDREGLSSESSGTAPSIGARCAQIRHSRVDVLTDFEGARNPCKA